MSKIVKCPRCKHQWDFKGDSKRVKCAECGKYFQIEYERETQERKTHNKTIVKIKNRGLSEETLAFLGNDFNPVTNKKFLMDNIAIVLGDELTKEIKEESRKIKMTEINLIRLIIKQYLKREK